jgi:excisionase family DNA binding protein
VTDHTKLAYTVPQACDASGIGRTRLYELIAAGNLEARRCGGRTLIPAASLAAYIASLPAAPIRAKETAR